RSVAVEDRDHFVQLGDRILAVTLKGRRHADRLLIELEFTGVVDRAGEILLGADYRRRNRAADLDRGLIPFDFGRDGWVQNSRRCEELSVASRAADRMIRPGAPGFDQVETLLARVAPAPAE